jgi:hypothetical protein
MITRTIKQTGLALAVTTFAFSTSCKKEKKEANTMPNGSYAMTGVRIMGMNMSEMLDVPARINESRININIDDIDPNDYIIPLKENLLMPKTDAQKKFSYLFWASFKSSFQEYKKLLVNGQLKDFTFTNISPGATYSSLNSFWTEYFLDTPILDVFFDPSGLGSNILLATVNANIIMQGAVNGIADMEQINDGESIVYDITQVTGSHIKLVQKDEIKSLTEVLIAIAAMLDSPEAILEIGKLVDMINPADINMPFESWDGTRIPILNLLGNLLQPKTKAFSLSNLVMNELKTATLGEIRGYVKSLTPMLSKINSLPTLLAQARFNFTPTQLNVMTGETFSDNKLSANIEWIDQANLHARMYYHFDTANPYKRVALRATFEPTANGYLMAPQDLEGGIMDIVNLLLNGLGSERVNTVETKALQSRLNLGNLIQLELTKVK